MEIRQYQVVLVNLDPTIGSEMQKTRPYVVISPDEMNAHLQTIVVAPMTSASKPYPTRAEVMHNKTKGWVVLDQIRTIDRKHVVKTYDFLSKKEIQKVKNIVYQTYVA
jgi:mRNA interferase MazF